MMHTDKYFLVPSSLNQSGKPVDYILNNLDGEMMRILNNKNLPADAKWAEYSQILQRPNYMKKDRDNPLEIHIYETSESKSLNFEDILVQFQKNVYQ